MAGMIQKLPWFKYRKTYCSIVENIDVTNRVHIRCIHNLFPLEIDLYLSWTSSTLFCTIYLAMFFLAKNLFIFLLVRILLCQLYITIVSNVLDFLFTRFVFMFVYSLSPCLSIRFVSMFVHSFCLHVCPFVLSSCLSIRFVFMFVYSFCLHVCPFVLSSCLSIRFVFMFV